MLGLVGVETIRNRLLMMMWDPRIQVLWRCAWRSICTIPRKSHGKALAIRNSWGEGERFNRISWGGH